MVDPKPQLHQSMLRSLTGCWPQFVYRYGKTFGIHDEYETRPFGLAAAAGIAVHAGVETGMKHKKKEKVKPEIGMLYDSTRDEITNQWDKGLHLYGDDSKGFEKSKGILVDRSIGLTKLYYTKVMDGITPKGIEEPFVITLKGYDFDLSGRIDTRVYAGIRDVKTKAGAPDKGAAHTIQSYMYALAYKMRQKRNPDFVIFDYLSTFPTKAGFSFHTYQRSVKVGENFIDPLYRRIEQFATIIQLCKTQKVDPLKVCPAADPSGWMCTKKYCPYADRCRFWSGRDE